MKPMLLISLLSLTGSAWAQAPVPAAVAPAPRHQAVVVISEGGGLDAMTLHTLRVLVASELRNRGLQVAEDTRLDGVHPAGAETQELAGTLGDRIFLLRIAGRLGTRVPLSLEEVDAQGNLKGSVSHTAATLEECDVVVVRLVEALVNRKTMEETARIATVTAAESRPYQKKPGERFWVLGLPMPLFSGAGSGSQSGFSVGWMHEAEHFAVGFQLLGTTNKDQRISAITLDTTWIPMTGEVSPTFGLGFGYLNTENANGVGLKLMAGLELFRLHGTRVKAGFELCVPMFDNSKIENTYTYSYTYPYTSTYSSRKVTGPSSYGILHLQVAF